MSNKPKVYIETSVVSYLVGRPSKDLIVAARQIITHDWWENELPKFEGYISTYVIDEAKEGDPKLAHQRERILSNFLYLEDADEIEKIAEQYLLFTGLPGKCRLDCEHMAIASYYQMEYLVSWNCKHIVNAMIIRKIREANDLMMLNTPSICTPEELYKEDK